ncbi:hypothetical protein RFI_15255 [Reticulomyxa filosa]|uniref:Uncharacterized protein n=1 Tax=Reticulomyxa filosa TaxID=46433 RepID=X6N9H6_RETFI|nr:hypothetical protein RFI_15255 [Reticulomyxa filosa]|eukprot:ETO21947.1 hypothetical protein RFI_15255 [Reticulomyxa filosa]
MSSEDINSLKRKGDEAFIKGGRDEEAIEHYTSALNIAKGLKTYDDRQRAKMYSSRGECYLRTQQYEKAVADCTESLKLDRTNFKSQFRRAKAYAQLNQTEAAIADLKIVIQKDSDNTQAKELLKELESKLKGDQPTEEKSAASKTNEGTAESTRKSNKTDDDMDVTKEDQNRICDYNALNQKRIDLEEEISVLSRDIGQLEAAESMIGMLLDEHSVRLQVGYTFFAIPNDTGDELVKQQLKALKARRVDFTFQLDSIVIEMKKQRGILKAKFKDKIGLPKIEHAENEQENE